MTGTKESLTFLKQGDIVQQISTGSPVVGSESIFNEEEALCEKLDVVSEKVGRWTFSGGAARKLRQIPAVRKSNCAYEREKFSIHSESQRLIRGMFCSF